MVYECCPYFKEDLIAKLKISSSFAARRLILTESNFTFKYQEKGYHFSDVGERVEYRKLDGRRLFRRFGIVEARARAILTRILFPSDEYFRLIYASSNWYNEAVQRNEGSKISGITDEDIVIFSDLDEFIDPRRWPEIESLVRKHDIITIPVYNTMFYFNLVSVNSPGPPNYSYRIFIMTGKHFRRLKMTPDRLRKAGEKGLLVGEVYCPDVIMGFHHSWVGDLEFVLDKLNSFAHSRGELGLDEQMSDSDIRIFITDKMTRGESIISGHMLRVEPNLLLLPEIEANRDRYQGFIL